jgi:hypothetical protein
MAEIDNWDDRQWVDQLASRLMYPMVSIDPGDIHVGVAVWDCADPYEEWVCQDAFETRPVPFLRALQVAVGSGIVQTVVFERFVLEPERVQASVGSDMLTSQMIGAIKFAVNGRCEIVGQTNQIKNPTRSVLRSRGIKSVAKRNKAGGHAFDAELHGAYHVIRTLGQEIAHG